MRRRLLILIAAFLATFALAAPALADFKCYCVFDKGSKGDGTGYCNKGDIGLSNVLTGPADDLSCANACGSSASVAITGSSEYYLLSQTPPNEHVTDSGIHCYENFTPPPTYTGSCKTVGSSENCGTATQVDTPCSQTIKTDGTPDSTSFFGDFNACKNQCSNGRTFCSGPTFTLSSQAASKSCTQDTDCTGGQKCNSGACQDSTSAPAVAGQGGTGNNQILSGSVLTLPLPLGNISLPSLIARVIQQVLSIVGALALLFFVWGGLRWMLARGAPEEVAKAKKTIVAALSGLIAIFTSYAILDLIIKNVSK